MRLFRLIKKEGGRCAKAGVDAENEQSRIVFRQFPHRARIVFEVSGGNISDSVYLGT